MMKRSLVLLMLLCICCAGALGEAWDGSLPEEYVPVLTRYAAGLAGDEAVLETEVTAETGWMCCRMAGIDPLMGTGYAFADLNGDNVPELLIGDMPENGAVDGCIFEIMTLENGAPVSLIRGWERHRVCLVYDQAVGSYGYYAEGSGSAWESVFEYGLAGDDLPKWAEQHVIELKAEEDGSTAVWTLDGVVIAEDQAQAMIAQWQSRQMDLPMSPMQDWSPESIAARAELEQRFGFVDDQTPGNAETFRRSFQPGADMPVLDVVIGDTGRRRPDGERENVLLVTVTARDGSLDQAFEYQSMELPAEMALGGMAFLDDMNRDGYPDLVLTTARGAYNEFFVFCLWNAGQGRFDPLMTAPAWDWEAQKQTGERTLLELCCYELGMGEHGARQIISRERDGYAETRIMVYEWQPLGQTLALKDAHIEHHDGPEE